MAGNIICGSSETANLIRQKDWSQTPLGAIEGWSSSLVVAVNMALSVPTPVQILWGEELIVLYNDAFIPIVTHKHPDAIGRGAREVWAEVWKDVGKQLETVVSEGEDFEFHDLPLQLLNHDRLEEQFFSFTYSPIRDADGSIVGLLNLSQNTTAAIQAERKLKASERKATQVLRSIGDAVIVADADLQVTQLNSVAQRLTGWSEEEARGTSIDEVFRLLRADTREPMASPVERARALRKTVMLEHDTILLAKDGSERHVEDSVAPVTNEEGELTGVVVVFRDVTLQREERRRKESAAAAEKLLLRLSDAQNKAVEARDIMQVSAELLGALLNTGRVGYSEAAADMQSMSFETGWVQGDLQLLSGSVPLSHWSEGTSVDFRSGRTVVYEDVRDEPSLASELAHYEEIGAIAVVAVPYLRRGVWRGSLYVNHPQPRRWTPEEVALIEEVASRTAEAVERAQAEAELRALADRLGLAQQAGRMASWQWDLATGNFVWDGGSEWTFGRPPDEMTNADMIFTYLHPEDLDKVRHDLAPVLDGTGSYQSEFRVIWPDGTTHWILAFGRTVWSSAGKPTGVVGININVTEQKQAEAALMQTEKLAAVGRLASTMAHEINNPLEAVTNLLYLARTSSNLEEALPLLETADAELRRAASITSQALRFHRQATRPTLCDFEKLTHELFKGRHSRLRNVGATVEERDRTSRPVLCFEGEIRQVLNNLIGNAIDAMTGTGGKILLRGRDGTDWTTGREGMVLTLADTGAGMSQATKMKLFDAFFTTKGVAGTGLGLWVSKEIITRHAGRVHLRTSQRKGHSGTVFTVFLPYDAVSREAVD